MIISFDRQKHRHAVLEPGIIAGMISDELDTIFSLDYTTMYIQFQKHLSVRLFIAGMSEMARM